MIIYAFVSVIAIIGINTLTLLCSWIGLFGNTTFSTAWYFLLFWALFLLYILAYSAFVFWCQMHLSALYKSKKYNKLIQQGKFLILFVPSKEVAELMIYLIALAHFQLYDDEKCLNKINKIKHRRVLMQKFHFLALYALLQNDEESYKLYYEKLCTQARPQKSKRHLAIFQILVSRCEMCYKILVLHETFPAETVEKNFSPRFLEHFRKIEKRS